jgi:hypothetical protein
MPKTKDDFFVSENHDAEHDEEHLSPSGKYKLTIQDYNTSKTTGRSTWSYTRGIVTDVATDEQIADVRRNYSSFWHLWLVQEEKEYLLCGEDYQGYGVVDLENRAAQHYLPDAAKEGHGFCFSRVKQIAPDRILVNGCIWASPYEVLTLDVSDPLTLPYPEIDRRDNAGDEDPDFSDREESINDPECGKENKQFFLEQDQLCFGGALALAKHYFRKILDGEHLKLCKEHQEKHGLASHEIHCNCYMMFADFGLRGAVMIAREMTLLDLDTDQEHPYVHPPYEAGENYPDQTRDYPIPEQKELDDELIRQEMRGRRGEHRPKWSSNQ